MEQGDAAEAAGTKYILGWVPSRRRSKLLRFQLSYGFSGSINPARSAFRVTAGSVPRPLDSGSSSCGVGFKLTLFLLHTWAPDVHEGVSTPVTAISPSPRRRSPSYSHDSVFNLSAGIYTQLIPSPPASPQSPSSRATWERFKQSCPPLLHGVPAHFAGRLSIPVAVFGPSTERRAPLSITLSVHLQELPAFFVFGIIKHHRPESFDSAGFSNRIRGARRSARRSRVQPRGHPSARRLHR